MGSCSRCRTPLGSNSRWNQTFGGLAHWACPSRKIWPPEGQRQTSTLTTLRQLLRAKEFVGQVQAQNLLFSLVEMLVDRTQQPAEASPEGSLDNHYFVSRPDDDASVTSVSLLPNGDDDKAEEADPRLVPEPPQLPPSKPVRKSTLVAADKAREVAPQSPVAPEHATNTPPPAWSQSRVQSRAKSASQQGKRKERQADTSHYALPYFETPKNPHQRSQTDL